MPLWKEYLQPSTVDEVLQALRDSPRSTAVIAGGTDLLLDLEQGRHPPVETLIDVTQIDEMTEVRLEDTHIFIGAAVLLRTIVQNPLLQFHATCLVEGCGLIGGPQIRNVATLGGNVAHALPAADGTIALMAMDAQAQLASSEGREWKPLSDLFAGPGRTSFDRRKTILVGFRLPLKKPGEVSAFQRVMRPQGVAIAILNMAAWLSGTEDQIHDARLAVGPGGPRPFRAFQTEQFLKTREMDDKTLDQATEVLLEEIQLRTSAHRATEAYRRHLVGVLLERTLHMARARLEYDAATNGARK
jgi:CO/xanthine dehydrogenase FAD-binding subunit